MAYATRVGSRLVPSAGGSPRKLVEAGSPVWLGNDRLVVTVEREDASRLAVIESADAWPQPLVRAARRRLARNGDEVEATVSPDGRTVAFSFGPRTTSTAATSASSTSRAARYGPHGDGRHQGRGADVVSRRRHARLLGAARRVVRRAPRSTSWRDGEQALAEPDADLSELRWSPDGTAIAAVRCRRGRPTSSTIDASTGRDGRRRRRRLGRPRWASDGSLVVTYEDHATPPELRRSCADGAIEHAARPGPARRRRRSARHARGGLVHVLRRTRDPGVPVPPAGGRRAPRSGRRLPARRADRVLRRRVGRARAVLRGQGLRVAGAQLPRLDGSGESFERLNFDDWGGGDTQDCLAAADFLRTLDWVDGERLAILGASYGSYLALCSPSRTPGALPGAVCKYGDCDLLTTWAQGDRDGRPLLRREHARPPVAEPRGLPAWLADPPRRPVAVPLLIATASATSGCIPAVRRARRCAAQLGGKTFEYVTYPTEAHGFLRAGPQIDFYRRLERFLDWYLL